MNHYHKPTIKSLIETYERLLTDLQHELIEKRDIMRRNPNGLCGTKRVYYEDLLTEELVLSERHNVYKEILLKLNHK